MLKLTLLLFFIPGLLFAQSAQEPKIGPHPIIIVDSVRINNDDLTKINPSDIAMLTVLHDTSAVKLYGEEGKDGMVICVTKILARKNYIAFFRRKSTQYDSLYTTTNSDSTFQYIINDKVKSSNFEGDLASINDDLVISLEILTADELKNKYGITGKNAGVIIYSRKPNSLYHKDDKF